MNIQNILKAKFDNNQILNIIDNLSSNSSTDALSAKQGKELKSQIDNKTAKTVSFDSSISSTQDTNMQDITDTIITQLKRIDQDVNTLRTNIADSMNTINNSIENTIGKEVI